jgi:competence protein ComGF
MRLPMRMKTDTGARPDRERKTSNCQASRRALEGGFALLEMLTALLLLSFILVSACRLYLFAYNNWTDGYMEEQILQKMQRAQSFLEQDIKQAQVNANPAYNYALSVASDGNEIMMFGDLNDDGELERIHYRLAGSQQVLLRIVVQPKPDGTYDDPPTPDPASWAPWTPLLTNITGGVSGTVDTAGTAVTLVSGTPFSAGWVAGTPININSTRYLIDSVTDASHLVLQSSAGTHTGFAYTVPIFVADSSDSDHPNLTVGVTLRCSNPARPTQPLMLSTKYAVRSNINMQGV